jgi:NAD+ kinase
LVHKYGQVEIEKADVIVALGGDGFMLSTMHQCAKLGVPLYGMNKGTVGFLMNDYNEIDLTDRLVNAEPANFHPLRMLAIRADGTTEEAIAFNEVSVLRETRQAAKIQISVDGRVRLKELICDGVMVATAAGSTAYNLSAHGPILPIDSRLLALTPISVFRPRRWRGALLPHKAEVRLQMIEADKRPTSAVADHTEVRNVVDVRIHEDRKMNMACLFDPEHSLEERILLEQFIG